MRHELDSMRGTGNTIDRLARVAYRLGCKVEMKVSAALLGVATSKHFEGRASGSPF